MVTEEDTGELYKVYRPTKIAEVRGQPEAVAMLKGFIQKRVVPQCIMFTGPPGTGKTTLARIMRAKMGCSDIDYQEINCASDRGIDMAREIRRVYQLAPMAGRCRVWTLDEFHKTTGDAQNAFLKMFEDTPRNVHFMLCTTDPGRVIPTIRSRATVVALKPLPDPEMQELLNGVAGRVGFTLTDDVRDEIIRAAEGGARTALVTLNAVLDIPDEAGQLAAITRGDYRAEAFAIAKRLMFGPQSWPEMAKMLKAVEGEPEGIRRLILAFATSCLLGGAGKAPTKPGRAAEVIHIFHKPIFETGKAANALLALYCWDAVNSKVK